MYSVVLATVLTAGGASPAWGCHGCHGCCGGYNAFSCGGCFGCCGGCFGGCHGCWGGCYGSSCNGCWGSFSISFGCCGGCHGGCYGGCYGACYGYTAPIWVYGAYGGGGTCYGCAGSVTYSAPATTDKKQDKKDEKKGDKKQDKESNVRPTQATVVVELPADARMMIDNTVSDLTSDSRMFVTPDLIPGQDYYYTIKAEVIRDGKKVSQSQKIFVRAGRTTRVEFGDMADTSAARR
jgi:uncharacterized protein (TIGR03000 family)